MKFKLKNDKKSSAPINNKSPASVSHVMTWIFSCSPIGKEKRVTQTDWRIPLMPANKGLVIIIKKRISP